MWPLCHNEHVVIDLPDDGFGGKYPTIIYTADGPLSESSLEEIIYMLQHYRLNERQLTQVTEELKRRINKLEVQS